MRVFALKAFRRFQRKERIGDDELRGALRLAEQGLIDADLGGGLIEQRIARPGKGRSGGYRSVIAMRAGDRAVFLFCYAKSDKDALDNAELRQWQAVGQGLLRLDNRALDSALADGNLMEIEYHDEE